jgi:hypothetical protein
MNLEQFLKTEYDIKPYSNLYDLSMDIHCDVGYSELYDDDLLKAISNIQGKKLSSHDREEWFNAKNDWENS